MKENKTQKLNAASVSGRLGLCAAALTGTAAAIPSADAAIITNNINLPIPQTFAGFYLNFLTGVAGGSGAGTPGWDWNPYQSNGGTQLGFYWAPTPAGNFGGVGVGTSYTDLPLGSVVSAASNFILTINGTTPNFRTTGTHILGFRFFNEATSAVNFGYLTISTTAASGFPATLLSYSYENTGTAITVPIPEPSTSALLGLAALALGAVGVRKWRRQAAA